MNTLSRAFLSVHRKKGKSIVLFMVLLVVSTFVLVGLSIKYSADTAAQELRHSLGGSFGLVVDKSKSENFIASENQSSGVQYAGAPLDDSVIEEVLKTPNIESYNASQIEEAILTNANGEYLELVETNNQYDDDETLLHTVTSEMNTDSEKSMFFSKGTFQITEGRHILPTDENVVLISKELAGLNNLEVGDQIWLQSSQEKTSSPFSIVGIYEIKEPQLNAGLVPPPSLYQNRIFIDDSNGESGEYQRLEFYVKDPAQLSNTIESAKENANIAWDDFAVETADEEYQRTAAPLENMSALVSSLLTCLIIGSALVLSLILSLWIKGRIHETGILLAMGYRKTQIFLQHFTEVMMIAVLAFGISFFAGQVVADVTGDLLLQNVSAQTETIASDTASSLEVEITVRNFAAVCGIGTLVVAFSVGMSNIPVFRLQPKEILSKMS